MMECIVLLCVDKKSILTLCMYRSVLEYCADLQVKHFSPLVSYQYNNNFSGISIKLQSRQTGRKVRQKRVS